MQLPRRTFAAAGMAAALAAGGVTAAVATNQTDAPPKIAFLANGHVAADALAAGPIAGQLGAPMYTTAQDALSTDAADALKDYGPELVIVLGGPVAVSDGVIDQVEAATGLSETDAATPDGGVIRAAGSDRFETATVVAGLLAAYNPAFVTAGGPLDADTLDGMDSTAFLPADGKADTAGHADTADSAGHATTADSATDADTVDGRHASDFLPATAGAGVPVAIVNVNGSGWANNAWHRAPATGDPAVVLNTNDSYTITVPGIDFSWVNDAVMCTSLSSDPVTIVTGEYDGTIRVNSYDDTGVKVTDNFMCVVYELGS